METIFLHGNVGLPSDWDAVLSELALSSYSAPVLWEYFRQPRRHSLADWAEWFCESLPQNQNTVLVGYSLGGRLALHALLSRPRSFAGAVIISAHPGLEHQAEQIVRTSADHEWSELAWNDWDTFLTKWQNQPVFEGSSALPDRDRLTKWQREIVDAFRGCSLAAQENLRPRLAEIRCPILWLSGKRDQKFTTLASEAAGTTNSRHVVVRDAGHRVPMDQPKIVARTIAEFLDALP